MYMYVFFYNTLLGLPPPPTSYQSHCNPTLYNAARNPATPIANPSPAPAFNPAVAIGTPAAEVGLCSAAFPLGVGVGVAPEPEEVLLDEPEALGAGVDDAVDAHEAEVGRSTPLALHKPAAVPMIAERAR